MSAEHCLCGARSLKMHKQKLKAGFYKHEYTGPGKHVLIKDDKQKGK